MRETRPKTTVCVFKSVDVCGCVQAFVYVFLFIYGSGFCTSACNWQINNVHFCLLAQVAEISWKKGKGFECVCERDKERDRDSLDIDEERRQDALIV